MTVKELKQKIANLPDDMPVVVYAGEEIGMAEYAEVSDSVPYSRSGYVPEELDPDNSGDCQQAPFDYLRISD